MVVSWLGIKAMYITMCQREHGHNVSYKPLMQHKVEPLQDKSLKDLKVLINGTRLLMI